MKRHTKMRERIELRLVRSALVGAVPDVPLLMDNDAGELDERGVRAATAIESPLEHLGIGHE
jgi:hypothetical protein